MKITCPTHVNVPYNFHEARSRSRVTGNLFLVLALVSDFITIIYYDRLIFRDVVTSPIGRMTAGRWPRRRIAWGSFSVCTRVCTHVCSIILLSSRRSFFM